ncbi:MAG: hypothetical protein NC483_05165 [Ruminococcus sp.]|nr:hypothetical protein [Ruminococcus sp.]
MKIIIGYLIIYFYLFSVIIITNCITNRFSLKEEYPRKIIHVMVGFSWFLLAYFFNTSINLVIIPLTFTIINYISYKKDLIKVMERKDKKSLGTVYFALSYTILALITYFKRDFLPFFGIGALTMTISDGLAPIIASKLPTRTILKTNKTYSGSLFIFLSSLIVVLLFSNYYKLTYSLLSYITLGFSAVLLELIGNKGLDNLTLPLGISLLSYFLI